MQVSTVIKRDGNQEDFQPEKITKAIYKCLHQGVGLDSNAATFMAQKLTDTAIKEALSKTSDSVLNVEKIQDVVERVLMENGLYTAAKKYILYREDHRKSRTDGPIPEAITKAFDEDTAYFPTDIQRTTFLSRYAR